MPLLEPAAGPELDRVREWVIAGTPIDRAGPAMSEGFMRTALYKQLPELAPGGALSAEADGYALDLEAAFLDLALADQLAALRTARELVVDAGDWARAGLLHYYGADALAARGFGDASEHIMRAVTHPLRQWRGSNSRCEPSLCSGRLGALRLDLPASYSCAVDYELPYASVFDEGQ